MARPLKDGVDYFPKDTSFYTDDKVRILRANFGAKGMYLLDYILCDLYSKNGYYIKWDKDKCFLVSDGAGCGCGPNFVNEFVAGCLQCSFFDKRVFDLFGILTSVGIQRRFIRMLKSREKFNFIEEYFLLDKSDNNDVPQGILDKLTFKKISCIENPFKSEENPEILSDNAQSKIEENKIKEIKKSEERTSRFTPPTLEEVKKYCNERNNNVDAQRFIDYYTSNGWYVGKNKMKDWKAAVRTWESNGYDKHAVSNTSNKNSFQNYDNELSDFEVELMQKRMENNS